jgi:hypothetical protein
VDARGISLFNEVSWSLPHLLEIDIGKETEAQAHQWRLGVGNFEQFAAERQTTREKMFASKRSDIEAALSVASEINDAHPEAALTWRDIIDAGGKTEKAVQAAAAADGKPASPEPSEPEDDEKDGDQ